MKHGPGSTLLLGPAPTRSLATGAPCAGTDQIKLELDRTCAKLPGGCHTGFPWKSLSLFSSTSSTTAWTVENPNPEVCQSIDTRFVPKVREKLLSQTRKQNWSQSQMKSTSELLFKAVSKLAVRTRFSHCLVICTMAFLITAPAQDFYHQFRLWRVLHPKPMASKAVWKRKIQLRLTTSFNGALSPRD